MLPSPRAVVNSVALVLATIMALASLLIVGVGLMGLVVLLLMFLAEALTK